MQNKLSLLWQNIFNGTGLTGVFIAFTILCVWVATISNYYIIAAAPVLLLVIYITLVDFKYLYWLLIAAIPISTEVYLPNGLGTDLPTEPMIVGLMLVFGIYVLQNMQRLSFDFFRHPLSLLVISHLAWIFITTLSSDLFVVSFKFFLAKLWYIFTFFFLTAYLIRDPAFFKRLFWVFFWPFTLVVLIIFVRHGMIGFSFAEIHSVLHPFQRNHVNYAASLSLFFPFLILARQWYERGSWLRWLLTATSILVFIAIYFTYTRAAYIALIIALGAYFVIQWKLVRYALILSVLIGVVGIWNVVEDNKYLDLAPNYDRTVSHENFDNLIEATYKMEDISTMERVYRWVAAGHMTPQRPMMGWGPGNFVNFYKSFTVTSFQTYVSDNPEQSGIHSYFLMTLVEQGIPGLLIFISLLFVFFIRGEKLYHTLAAFPDRQRIVMICLLSTVIITAFLLINDLIETDKVGSFFFINIAVLIQQDLFLYRIESKKE